MNSPWKHLLLLAVAATFPLSSAVALAAGPVPPSGWATINQSAYGLPLTKSDSTVLVPTRGVYIGDAAPCNLSVEFASNPGTAVAIDSVQPGLTYPFSISKLKAATTCADVVGLW